MRKASRRKVARLRNPHDALFQGVFGAPARAAELLRHMLPRRLARRIDWSSLRAVGRSFVDDALRFHHADLVFTARVAGRRTLIFQLLEHKSFSCRLTVLRVAGYTLRLWERWLADHPHARSLPAVLSFVLAHGKRRFRGPRQLRKLIALPRSLRSFCGAWPDFSFEIADLNTRRFRHLLRRVMPVASKLPLLHLQELGRRKDPGSRMMPGFVGHGNLVRAVAIARNRADQRPPRGLATKEAASARWQGENHLCRPRSMHEASEEHHGAPIVGRCAACEPIMSDQLPSFDRPPLIETVLGVQFAPVDGLTSAHLGLFWREIGPEWTKVQEGEPIGQTLLDEDAGAFSPDTLVLTSRARRLRFLDASSSRMVQVENGWLVYNWRRRAPGDPYPRFETLLPEFQRTFRAWCTFLVSQGFGEPRVNLWEVCYVNDIEKGTVWNTPQEWAALFPSLLAAPALSQVGAPSTASARWRFPIARLPASLEVILTHVADGDGHLEILRLTQLARGSAGNLAGLEQGLHDGRRAIVHTFAEITSAAAHRYWGRTR